MQWNGVERVIKVIVSVVAIGVAVLGLNAYKNARETEARRFIAERQLEIFTDIMRIARNLESSSSEEERLELAKDFYAIYLGPGRAFLDGEMFSKLAPLREYIGGCVRKFERFKDIDCEHFSPLMRTTGLAAVMRSHLEKTWGLDLGELDLGDPYSYHKKIDGGAR